MGARVGVGGRAGGEARSEWGVREAAASWCTWAEATTARRAAAMASLAPCCLSMSKLQGVSIFLFLDDIPRT